MSDKPLCVLGDFNQPIPRIRQPTQVAHALADILCDRLEVSTAGKRDIGGKQLIDHYAHTDRLIVRVFDILPKIAEDGTDLSDHVGVVASIMIR